MARRTWIRHWPSKREVAAAGERHPVHIEFACDSRSCVQKARDYGHIGRRHEVLKALSATSHGHAREANVVLHSDILS